MKKIVHNRDRKATKGILHITCAGMPERCHQYVTWDNFTEGSEFEGKLQMSHVAGGIMLKDIKFTIKN